MMLLSGKLQLSTIALAEMVLHSGKVQLSRAAVANNDACYSLLLCSLEGLASGQDYSHTIKAEADLTI